MSDIPRRMPAMMPDLVLVYLDEIGDMTLHLEMVFAHRLDADRLARAIDLACDAEPVLGCRFVVNSWRPYWERIDRTGWQPLRIVAEQAAYDAFRAEPADARHRPQVHGCLWRAPDGDHLLLKVAHQAADAGGCKHVSRIVAGLYTRLGHDPNHRPEPNAGTRSPWQVLRRIPWHGFLRIYWNFLRETVSNASPPRSHVLVAGSAREGGPCYVIRHLDAERVARLANYGRTRGATLNDLLMTATQRAIFELSPWNGRDGLRTYMTADMRNYYLPSGSAEAVCNLSAIEPINLGRDLGADFDATLSRMVAWTRARKANYIALSGYVGVMPSVWLLPFALTRRIFRAVKQIALANNIANAMTNLGPVKPIDVTFDQPAREAWVVCPPIFPPLCGYGVSGYAGRLTMSAGVYRPGLPPEQMERYFDKIVELLPG